MWFSVESAHEYKIKIEGITDIEVMKSITDSKIRPIFNSTGFFDSKTNVLTIESDVYIDKETFERKTGLKIILFEIK